jgi:hypothetical protein
MTKFDPKKDIIVLVDGGCVVDYCIPDGCQISIIDEDADVEDEEAERFKKKALAYFTNGMMEERGGNRRNT